MHTERKNAIRRTVIDTASRLFYKQGYANTAVLLGGGDLMLSATNVFVTSGGPVRRII